LQGIPGAADRCYANAGGLVVDGFGHADKTPEGMPGERTFRVTCVVESRVRSSWSSIGLRIVCQASRRFANAWDVCSLRD
jgi:hypothetical protein